MSDAREVDHVNGVSADADGTRWSVAGTAPERQNTVNPALTQKVPSEQRPRKPRKRPKQERETPEFADMVERMIMAYARRVGQGDVDELPRMIAMHDILDDALQTAVTGLKEFGYSWTEIANRTQTSRQAAHQRWGTQPSINQKVSTPPSSDGAEEPTERGTR